MLHNLLGWIGGICAVLATAALYVQFLIGEDDQPIRDRLEGWYRATSASDWRGFINFSLRSTDKFLSYLFGAPILSLRFVLVAGSASVLINLIAMLAVANHLQRLFSVGL